jgi:hypothetical protein
MTSVHVFLSQMIGKDVPIVAIRSGRFCSLHTNVQRLTNKSSRDRGGLVYWPLVQGRFLMLQSGRSPASQRRV